MKNKFIRFLLLIGVITSFGCRSKQNNAKTYQDYFNSSGTKIYYEICGNGPPLLILHGNGSGMYGMKPQIDFFKSTHKVISMDCRGRGKSDLGTDTLTYEIMMQDAVNLLNYLKIDSTDCFGYSDGGIIGLLLAIHQPGRIRKLAVFGVNTKPDTNALYKETIGQIEETMIEASQKMNTKNKEKNWNDLYQRMQLLYYQPHISAEQLRAIRCPVLLMSTDRDLIKTEHTLEIYREIPKCSLHIFNSEKHNMPKTNPNLLNQTMLKFFNESFLPDYERFK